MIACFFSFTENSEACNKLKLVLDQFCTTSGQLINYHKSALTFSRNASLIQKQIVIAILNTPRRESLGKYLDCPVFQGHPWNTTIQEIINRAITKLDGWKTNCLSKVGRSVLIQSHLESLPTHTMQYFQLLKETIDFLDKCNRDFF